MIVEHNFHANEETRVFQEKLIFCFFKKKFTFFFTLPLIYLPRENCFFQVSSENLSSSSGVGANFLLTRTRSLFIMTRTEINNTELFANSIIQMFSSSSLTFFLSFVNLCTKREKDRFISWEWGRWLNGWCWKNSTAETNSIISNKIK